MGTRLFRAKIFPIEPRGERRVRISYTEMISADAGFCTYRYPLSTEKFSSKPLENVAVSVAIETTVPLKTVFSPSHEVDVVRKDDFHARAGFEKKNVKPHRDFLLYYSLSNEELGASLVSSGRTAEDVPFAEDGYFALFLSPRHDLDADDVVEKDVIFVIDTSGSMKEPGAKPTKIDQAKGALRFCVGSLNRGDRFNVISFATAARPFRNELQPAGSEICRKALGFIDSMKAAGGTNIHEALLTAFGMQDKGSARPCMIVFLTDGLPTVGDLQGIDDLAGFARRNAEPSTRFFSFGVGHDVNTILLDRMAREIRGDRMYVAPDENIEVKVSGFYEKIACPVMSDVEVVIEGVEAYDLLPARLPDIFRGSQLVVYGRYAGSGGGAVRLRGTVNDKKVEYAYDATFAGTEGDQGGIARLWATAKIGYLLDQLRLKGIDYLKGSRVPAEKEIIDEIIELATRHGVVTPYTALLVVEDIKAGASPATPLAMRFSADSLEESVDGKLKKARIGAGRAVGGPATELSMSSRGLKTGFTAPQDTDFLKAMRTDETIRHFGGKTFILVNGVWFDTLFREGTETRKIVFLSDEYFDLATGRPVAARCASLGPRVVFCLEGKAFEIVPDL